MPEQYRSARFDYSHHKRSGNKRWDNKPTSNMVSGGKGPCNAFSTIKAPHNNTSASAIASASIPAGRATAEWRSFAVDAPRAYQQAIAEYSKPAPAQEPFKPASEVNLTTIFKPRKVPAANAATEKGLVGGEPAAAITVTTSKAAVVLPPHLRAKNTEAAAAVSAASTPKVVIPPHLRPRKRASAAVAAAVAPLPPSKWETEFETRGFVPLHRLRQDKWFW